MRVTSITLQDSSLMRISSEEKTFFEENGFLIIDQLFNLETCQKLQEDAHQYAGDNIHNYLNFHREIDSFNKLITNSSLHDICDQVLEARMIPIGSIFFFGKPNNPLENGSLPHQDNYAAKAPSGSYLVASLSLSDADEENGALYVYPGSNKLPELPFEESKNFEFDDNGKLIKNYPIGNKVKAPDKYKKKILKYKTGDLILLHSNIIHGAEKNINQKGKWRHQFYMHFIKDGDPFWPGWNARRQIMDRGPKRL